MCTFQWQRRSEDKSYVWQTRRKAAAVQPVLHVPGLHDTGELQCFEGRWSCSLCLLLPLCSVPLCTLALSCMGSGPSSWATSAHWSHWEGLSSLTVLLVLSWDMAGGRCIGGSHVAGLSLHTPGLPALHSLLAALHIQVKKTKKTKKTKKKHTRGQVPADLLTNRYSKPQVRQKCWSISANPWKK